MYLFQLEYKNLVKNYRIAKKRTKKRRNILVKIEKMLALHAFIALSKASKDSELLLIKLEKVDKLNRLEQPT